MSLIILGVSHKTAAIDLRERLAFSPPALPKALGDVRRLPGVKEAMILSTCNRTEITTCGGEFQELLDWLCRASGIGVEELEGRYYTHREREAVRHLMEVATGMDSMVFGETEIFGQIKQAHQTARDNKTVAGELGFLLEHTFNATKQIRSQTAISSCAVSHGSVVSQLALRLFERLAGLQITLVGSGKMMTSVARHLKDSEAGGIHVLGRSAEKAGQLAKDIGAHSGGLEDLPKRLEDADILVSCTSNPNTMITPEMMEAARKKRRHRMLLIVDLSVPRNVHPDVGKMEDTYLYDIDGIQNLLKANRQKRQEAGRRAAALIHNSMDEYYRSLHGRQAASLIAEYREQAGHICDEELANSLRDLEKTGNAPAVMGELARKLTNKLTHLPTTWLRQAPFRGNDDES